MKVDLSDAYVDTAPGQEAQSLLLPCVQCGQCTFQCPTFRLMNDEWDGPRGRIHLMKLFFEGKPASLDLLPPAYTLKDLADVPLEQNLRLHLDRCLTCRSCEASCPYGVKFGRLLDVTREELEIKSPRPFKDKWKRKVVRKVISSRSLFRTLLGLGRMVRGLLPKDTQTMIPDPRPAGVWPGNAHPRTMMIWQGCVQPVLAPDINAATARVLDRFGIRVVPAAGGCCGSLSQHMGEPKESLEHVRKTIELVFIEHVDELLEHALLEMPGRGDAKTPRPRGAGKRGRTTAPPPAAG